MTTLNRWQAYIILKNILCRYGAIPKDSDQYESLVTELLDLIKIKLVNTESTARNQNGLQIK